MTSGPTLPLKRFYSTRQSPCPYLPDRLERKVFTELVGTEREPDDLHETLTTAGFRRSHGIAYKPICQGCNECVPVRVPVATFAPTPSMRRVLANNRTLRAIETPTVATREQFDLFARYEASRHADGGMASMDFDDYQAMVEESPIRTEIYEFRASDGALRAVALTDVLRDGYSMVYSFFDPDQANSSPGTFMILWHLRRAVERNVAYVYLGYWIRESRKMAYKARFRPLERLGPAGWERLSDR